MTARPTYFDDPAIDQVMRVTLELAAEVYVLKDRQRILEKLLEQKGQISRADLDTYKPDEQEAEEIRRGRDQFIAHLLGSLVQQPG